MKTFLSWKWISLGVFCVAIGVAEYLNFTDFCYSEWRYLGDAGLIDAAIAYEISHVSPAESQHAVKYESVAAFHNENSICCYLAKWGVPNLTFDRRVRIWMRRLVGEYYIVVELWYRFRNDGPTPYSTSHYLVDSCGRVREPGIPGGGPSTKPATREWEERGWSWHYLK